MLYEIRENVSKSSINCKNAYFTLNRNISLQYLSQELVIKTRDLLKNCYLVSNTQYSIEVVNIEMFDTIPQGSAKFTKRCENECERPHPIDK